MVTPFWRISRAAADSAEFHSMSLWGTKSLLNTVLPSSMIGRRWLWVLRRSVWKHVSSKTSAEEVRYEVKRILSLLRVNTPLEEYLHLLTRARPALPASEFRDFFMRVQPKIANRFDLKLPYHIVLRIPLITPKLKSRLKATILRHLCTPDAVGRNEQMQWKICASAKSGVTSKPPPPLPTMVRCMFIGDKDIHADPLKG